MGFQYRKRTKGKKAWLNFSASKKRGVGASASVKLAKNVTYNTRGRLTINFGNGMRYVAYKRKKRAPKVIKERVERSYSRRREEPSYTASDILTMFQNSIIQTFTTLHPNGADDVDIQTAVDLINSLEMFRGLDYYETISRVEYDTIVVNKNLYVDMLRDISRKQPELKDNLEGVISNLNYFVHSTNRRHRAPVTDFKPETMLEKLTGGVKRLFSIFK